MVTPGLTADKPPAFHELGARPFEELCRDLFDAEPGIGVCSLYGDNGQDQFGVDLIASRKDDAGVEVGQCKACQEFSVPKLVEASDVFLKHWESVWSRREVKRFVLFVGCELSSRKLQDAILEQSERFRKLGVQYEAWDSAKLRNKLRPHPYLVSNYFSHSEYWKKTICGIESSPSLDLPRQNAGRDGVAISLLAEQFEKLSEIVSSDAKVSLRKMRDAFREGHSGEVKHWIQEVRQEQRWKLLSAEVKARVLCFEGSILLSEDASLIEVERLADEAHNLSPTDAERRLRALVARKKRDVQKALELLLDLSDIDSLNLRASILLEMEKSAEASALLMQAEADSTANAETFRLRAISYFFQGEFGQAQLEIQKAMQLAPDWRWVRFSHGMILYYSALAPLSRSNYTAGWPSPVDWALVKQDAEAQANLSAAADIFRSLAEKAEGNERLNFHLWEMVSVANIPTRQDAAIDLCRKILNTNPCEPSVLAWVLARNFDADLASTEQQLDSKLKSSEPSVALVLLAASCKAKRGFPKDAGELLDTHRDLFLKVEEVDSWYQWKAQFAVAAKEVSAVELLNNELKEISSNSEVIRHARLIVLRALADWSGEFGNIEIYLEEQYTESGNPGYLIALCEIKSERGNQEYVVRRGNELIEKVPTAYIVRLVAIAAFKTGDYKSCLQTLDGHLTFFRDGKLPSDLRMVRTQALGFIGSVPSAVVEAKKLVEESPSLEHHLLLAQMYLNSGDLLGLNLVAKKLKTFSALKPEHMLWLARWSRDTDSGLALDLWRMANKVGFSDDLVAGAFSLGAELGIDDELAPLVSRMAQLAQSGRGGIRAVTISEMREWILERKTSAEKAGDLYARGTIPIHMIHRQLPVGIAEMYHLVLDLNSAARNAKDRYPVLVRHASRPLNIEIQKSMKPYRLHLDITAALLAEHFSLLDLVERSFKPIRISQQLIPALIKMKDELNQSQPMRLKAAEEIIEAVKSKKVSLLDGPLPEPTADLKSWAEEQGPQIVRLFLKAREMGGYLLTFLPLMDRDRTRPSTETPADAQQVLFDCFSAAKSLRDAGPLSESSFQSIVKKLGPSGPRDCQTPVQGRTIIIQHIVGILAAEAGMFAALCDRFRVIIEPVELRMLELMVEAQRRKVNTSEFIESLIKRLNSGIHDGRYETFASSRPKANADGDGPGDLELGGILDVAGIDGQADDLVWIDDRFLTGYPSVGKAMIVGIVEMLHYLTSVGTFDSKTYFGKLAELRSANIRYIPLLQNEILHHLGEAQVDDAGKLIETAELSLLRQYLSSCLLSAKELQRPSRQDGQASNPGELTFALAVPREAVAAILGLWAVNDPNARIKSKWILDNIYVTHLAISTVSAMHGSERDERFLIATGLASFVAQSISLHSSKDDGSRRANYLEWVYSEILEPRFSADSTLLSATADYLKTLLRGMLENPGNSVATEESLAKKIIIHRLYNDLPPVLRETLGKDVEFLSSFGVQLSRTMLLGGGRFEVDVFWSAAAIAIKSGESKLRDVENDNEYLITPHTSASGKRGVLINFTEPVRKVVLEGIDFDVLVSTPEECERVLLQHRDCFDCTLNESRELIAEVASITDPVKKVKRFIDLRSGSASLYYESLAERLRNREEIQYKELIGPDTTVLLKHLGLTIGDGSGDLSAGFERASKDFVERGGPIFALDRLMSLPIALPGSLCKEIVDSTEHEKRKIVKKYLRLARSPVEKIHLLKVIALTLPRAVALRLMRPLVRRMIGDGGREEFTSFIRVLLWMTAEFDRQASFRELAAPLRLAELWSHSSEIYSLFRSAGITDRSIMDGFNDYRVPIELFSRDDSYWLDVVHPHNIDFVSFVAESLVYALSDVIDEVVGSWPDLWNFVYEKREDNYFPKVEMLKDLHQSSNSLGAFIGVDRDVLFWRFFGPNGVPAYSSEMQKKIAVISLEGALKGEESRAGWAEIRAFFQDLPIYTEMNQSLMELIKKTNIAELAGRDDLAARLAMQVSADQLNNFRSDELSKYIESQLVSFVAFKNKKIIAKDIDPSEREELSSFVTEIILRIAIARRSVGDPVDKFVDVASRVLEACEVVAPGLRVVVERLCKVIPISQADKFVPLLLRLRAQT